jgi:hypothetical protein
METWPSTISSACSGSDRPGINSNKGCPSFTAKGSPASLRGSERGILYTTGGGLPSALAASAGSHLHTAQA